MPATLFQYATPVSIIGSTSWAGSVTSVDEPPPFNDSDVMTSPTNSLGSGVSFSIEFQLTAHLDPNYYSDGFAVLVQAAKNSAATTQTLTFALKQAGVTKASSTFTLATSVALYSYALTLSEIASIAYSSACSLVLTALMPSGGISSNFVTLSGCAFQLPSVGFDHLIANNTGFKIVGPHYGLYLVRNTTGFTEVVGSETTGALVDLTTEHN